VRYQNLTDDPEEVVYWPATIGPAEAPIPSRGMYIVIRTTADPLSFVPVLRREMQEMNPRIPVAELRSMDDLMTAATARTSFTMVMLAVAAAVALLLGLVGIYGVISYIVAQRTREVGIRMALGATDRSVLLLVLRQGLVLTILGVIIGLVASGALSSLMRSILYGVEAIDPLTYGVLAVLQIVVATLASWLPGRGPRSVQGPAAGVKIRLGQDLPQAGRLLVLQCLEGIDPHGRSGRHRTRDESDDQQQDRYDREHERIDGTDPVEQTREKPGQND